MINKLFFWINFGENENDIFNAIASNSQPDHFQSLFDLVIIRILYLLKTYNDQESFYKI